MVQPDLFLCLPAGAGDGSDVSGVLIGLEGGGFGVLVGLTVGGATARVEMAVGAKVRETVGLGWEGDVAAGVGVPVVEDGGDWAAADGVPVTEGVDSPGSDVGIGVPVARDVARSGSTVADVLLPPILLPATTVPITHMRLPATSVPMVRIANRGNKRSRLIWLLWK